MATIDERVAALESGFAYLSTFHPPQVPPPPPAVLSGFKEVATIGSMAAGSKRITVAASAGFALGDQIIVAVGGEVGKGKRGTGGVGGVYPKENDYATLYYNNIDVPKALVAKVTKVESGAIEVDTPAVEATTGASVTVDNLPNWKAKQLAMGKAPGQTMDIPAGKFAVSDYLPHTQLTGWTIKGQGKDKTEIFSPDGARSAMLWMFQSPKTTVMDFTLRGNARLNGFGLGAQFQYPGGIYFGNACHDGVARDLRVIDVFQKAVGVDYCNNVWAYNIEAILTEGLARYVQWQFQWANCVGGGIDGGSIRSPTVTGGAEPFASENVTFKNLDLENALLSSNSAWLFKFESIKQRFTALTWVSDLQNNRNNPALNINTNFPTNDPRIQQGGSIKDLFITVDGYMNAEGDGQKGIVINSNNGKITVTGGGYKGPAMKDGFKLPSGTMYYPVAPMGLNSTGPSTFVDGFISTNAMPAWSANIFLKSGAARNTGASRVIVQTVLPWPA